VSIQNFLTLLIKRGFWFWVSFLYSVLSFGLRLLCAGCYVQVLVCRLLCTGCCVRFVVFWLLCTYCCVQVVLYRFLYRFCTGLCTGYLVQVVVYANTCPDWMITAIACFKHSLSIVTIYTNLGILFAVFFTLILGSLHFEKSVFNSLQYH